MRKVYCLITAEVMDYLKELNIQFVKFSNDYLYIENITDEDISSLTELNEFVVMIDDKTKIDDHITFVANYITSLRNEIELAGKRLTHLTKIYSLYDKQELARCESSDIESVLDIGLLKNLTGPIESIIIKDKITPKNYGIIKDLIDKDYNNIAGYFSYIGHFVINTKYNKLVYYENKYIRVISE